MTFWAAGTCQAFTFLLDTRVSAMEGALKPSYLFVRVMRCRVDGSTSSGFFFLSLRARSRLVRVFSEEMLSEELFSEDAFSDEVFTEALVSSENSELM